MKINYLLLAFLLFLFSPHIYSMEKKSFLNPSTGSSYIPDDSLIITFDNTDESDDEHSSFLHKKMLSTNSLENLKDLKKQGAIHNIKDLKKRGLKIIKQKPRWRQCGAAFRRYTTTFFTLGAFVGIAILVYYLYSAKTKIEPFIDKIDPFINNAEKFINKTGQTLDRVDAITQNICKKYPEFC